MNTYIKYCPNVFVAKCQEKHEKGETIIVTTKYGKEHECIVFNLVGRTKDESYCYSIVRADGFNVQEHAKLKAERLQRASMNAETEFGNQPLGDIAAIGRGGKPLNNGHVHYQCEEPGYIMGLMAITPMVDYSQGNDFDLNLQTIDDLHKPALDGIGYQDLIQEQMVGETSVYEGAGSLNNIKHLAANKTVDLPVWFNTVYTS